MENGASISHVFYETQYNSLCKTDVPGEVVAPVWALGTTQEAPCACHLLCREDDCAPAIPALVCLLSTSLWTQRSHTSPVQRAPWSESKQPPGWTSVCSFILGRAPGQVDRRYRSHPQRDPFTSQPTCVAPWAPPSTWSLPEVPRRFPSCFTPWPAAAHASACLRHCVFPSFLHGLRLLLLFCPDLEICLPLCVPKSAWASSHPLPLLSWFPGAPSLTTAAQLHGFPRSSEGFRVKA